MSPSLGSVLQGWTVCSAIGMSLVFYISYEIAAFVRLYTRASSIRRYLHTSSAGKPACALVTGASDGIGKAICFELASEGFDLVIHGRNANKMAGVKAELAAAHPKRNCRVLIADAFKCNTEAVDFDEIAKSLEDLHLTVLVNCAGAGPQLAFGTLEMYSKQEILDVINLNASFPALMSAAIIPKLLQSGGPGLIINIASVTDTGMPLVSFYGASKAFGHTINQSIEREMRMEGRDIEVISHRLGAVTGTSRVHTAESLFKPLAPTAAKAIVGRTGCGYKSVVPYWPHALQQVMLSLLPRATTDTILIDALRSERDIQNRELADAAKKG